MKAIEIACMTAVLMIIVVSCEKRNRAPVQSDETKRVPQDVRESLTMFKDTATEEDIRSHVRQFGYVSQKGKYSLALDPTKMGWEPSQEGPHASDDFTQPGGRLTIAWRDKSSGTLVAQYAAIKEQHRQGYASSQPAATVTVEDIPGEEPKEILVNGMTTLKGAYRLTIREKNKSCEFRSYAAVVDAPDYTYTIVVLSKYSTLDRPNRLAEIYRERRELTFKTVLIAFVPDRRPSVTGKSQEPTCGVSDADYASLDGLAPDSQEAQEPQRQAVQQPGFPMEEKIVDSQTQGMFRRLKEGSPQAAARNEADASWRTPTDLIEVGDAQYASLDGLASGSAGAQRRQREAVQQLGIPLEVKTRKTDIAFRLIPAGRFTMGSPQAEKDEELRAGIPPWHVEAQTEHEVRLSKPFYCGKFEVTQRQWEQVTGRNPSRFRNAGQDAPVEEVSWEDCQKFLKQLCQMEGVAENTYRLLTEAEWEYACRAGTTTVFCYGNDLDSSMANFNSDYPYGNGRKGQYRKTTMAVGSFRANAWGLYDMHGNMAEWCQDWYGNYPSGSVTDPLGPPSGNFRVHRGASWVNFASGCRSAARQKDSPDTSSYFIAGLRLARIAPLYISRVKTPVPSGSGSQETIDRLETQVRSLHPSNAGSGEHVERAHPPLGSDLTPKTLGQLYSEFSQEALEILKDGDALLSSYQEKSHGGETRAPSGDADAEFRAVLLKLGDLWRRMEAYYVDCEPKSDLEALLVVFPQLKACSTEAMLVSRFLGVRGNPRLGEFRKDVRDLGLKQFILEAAWLKRFSESDLKETRTLKARSRVVTST